MCFSPSPCLNFLKIKNLQGDFTTTGFIWLTIHALDIHYIELGVAVSFLNWKVMLTSWKGGGGGKQEISCCISCVWLDLPLVIFFPLLLYIVIYAIMLSLKSYIYICMCVYKKNSKWLLKWIVSLPGDCRASGKMEECEWVQLFCEYITYILTVLHIYIYHDSVTTNTEKVWHACDTVWQ